MQDFLRDHVFLKVANNDNTDRRFFIKASGKGNAAPALFFVLFHILYNRLPCNPQHLSGNRFVAINTL